MTQSCRNCGADAPWNYCPNCGQETQIALPSAFTFLRDAAGRYVRFDGRMWRSLHALAFRPGFLTREYLAGRRRRYVRPARLFVALSIVLFAVLRLTTETPTITDTASDDAGGKAAMEHRAGGTSHLGFDVDPDLNRAPASSVAAPSLRRASRVRRTQPRVRVPRRDAPGARA